MDCSYITVKLKAMISLSVFTDFCNYWWLWWILPFILGCFLAFTIMKKWRRMYEALQKDTRKLKNRNAEIEKTLEDKLKEHKELKGQLALQRGKIQELENKLKK